MSETELKGRNRKQTAWRIAQDIPDGSYVNLGIGAPELIANYLPEGREIIFHSENGLLGMGPTPNENEIDWDLINAGKKPVTLLPGGAFFHQADSFGMIRGQHLDYCVLGAFQVSETGDLANWITNEPDAIPAVGGAMDLGAGARNVMVFTDHRTKTGEPKIVGKCGYPLTAIGSITAVYTDLAVLDVTPEGFVVRELVDGVGFDELQALSGATLRPASDMQVHTPPAL